MLLFPKQNLRHLVKYYIFLDILAELEAIPYLKLNLFLLQNEQLNKCRSL